MEGPTVLDTGLERLLTEEFADEDNLEDFIVDHLQVGGNGSRGETQTAQYRDTPFALGFVVHLGVVLFMSLFWGVPVLFSSEKERHRNEEYDFHVFGFLFLLGLVSTASLGLASMSLDFMINHAESMMQITLMASSLVLVAEIVILFLEKSPGLGFLGIFFLICTGLYAYSVQRRIPFAAANLRTALSAIQTNYGVCMVAYAVAAAANLFVVFWFLAFTGIAFKFGSHKWSDDELDFKLNPYLVLFMLLSYFWTSQVLQNVLHVTVSGVIGTWWFQPQEAQSAFSPAIMDSLSRATSYSFGSICFGSLLVALIQAIEQLVHSMRQQGRNSLVLCIMECLLNFLQRVGRYFNKWAFVYVGLYGYDYVTAGRRVAELLQARGWSTIISDNLVHQMLLLVCLVVGFLSGLIGMFLADISGWADPLFGDYVHLAMFLVSCLIGFSLSFILMGVVISAVDSVIVCFAEAPGEFETHHPALHRNMVNSWKAVYPDECGF